MKETITQRERENINLVYNFRWASKVVSNLFLLHLCVCVCASNHNIFKQNLFKTKTNKTSRHCVDLFEIKYCSLLIKKIE